jgi:glycosyltransferase involved in cell wall biosynthesis
VWQSAEAGGADRVLFDLARHLPQYDVSLDAVVAMPDGLCELPGGVFSAGSSRSGTRARWLGTRRAVADRLTCGRVDVVASHFALHASAVLGRLGRIPHVVHFHGPWAAESAYEGAGQFARAAKWAVERLVYASADRIVVLSQAFAKLVHRTYGVDPVRIRIVPGAVDIDRFATSLDRVQARRMLGLPLDRSILVTVRRLVRRMGLGNLIEALPTVVGRRPDVLLCVGGNGPLRRQLERRVAELRLDAHVRFLGYVTDDRLPALYRAADLNVVPTQALEGFGLTAVEALAAGTPSIVTPVGGLPEAVGQLSTSLVLRSSDPAGISEGLSGVLAGTLPLPDDQQCRAYVRDRFSADLMARRIADVYHEVCR